MRRNSTVSLAERQPIARRLAVALLLVLVPAVARGQRSDVAVEVHGTILFNGFRNSGFVNNSDVPTIALPQSSLFTDEALGASVRQTRLGVIVRADQVLGGRLYAEADLDFHGGQQPSGGGRTHPLLRIRRAFVELRWDRGEVLVGQEAPPVFGASPLSLATVGSPGFASSGNLWLWLPQIRGTLWLARSNGLVAGIEATVLAPSAGEPQDPFVTKPDRAEQSGRPALEGRVVSRWSAFGRPGEASVGGHLGWLVAAPEHLVRSEAVGVMVQAPVARFLELRGEWFTGRALAGLGGGGIGQSITGSLTGVRTTGGWAQLVLIPAAGLELTAGAGQDEPNVADIADGGRRRNVVLAAGAIGRVAPLVAGLEIRRIRTTWNNAGTDLRAEAIHVNLAVGVEF